MKSINFKISSAILPYDSDTDLHLITQSIDIGVPQQKTNYLDIPGRNGEIDLSDSLGTYFSSYDIKIVFAVKLANTYSTVQSDVISKLNGKTGQIKLPDENTYRSNFRFSVAELKSDNILKQITVIAHCYEP